MNTVGIIKVTSSKDLKIFIEFPFRLYKHNKFWCPPLKAEEKKTLRRDKNPAFDYCEAEYWLAFRDGIPVGRIAGIINHRELERWNKKRVRFGWFDFIDDPEISRILLAEVAVWGRNKGMEAMHGPLGFNDMDPQGMLIEGFDQLSAYAAIYNYPYYPGHMLLNGFRKSTDWLQYELKIPTSNPDKVERVSKLVLEKYELHMLHARNGGELRLYARKLFRLYNEAFNDIYGFAPLTEKQIDYYTGQYLGYISPEFASIVLDKNDDVVGFGITMPSLSVAFQKANGSLFPFGFLHLMRAMKKNDIIHMYLIGLHPFYQGKGVLALIYNELAKAYMKAGIRIARTHPQLEDNLKAISIWKNYEGRVNIRRRCWIKEI